MESEQQGLRSLEFLLSISELTFSGLSNQDVLIKFCEQTLQLLDWQAYRFTFTSESLSPQKTLASETSLETFNQNLFDATIKTVVQSEFGRGDRPYQYGIDYVNLGFVAGDAVAISQLTSDIRKARSQDMQGTSLDSLPVMNDVVSLQDMQLLITPSAGFPGAKEWVQLFPYYPDQLVGLVTGIRGANEYESMLASKYPVPYAEMSKRPASLRGGPQRWAHRLMISLIVLGNAIHFANRYRRSSHS